MPEPSDVRTATITRETYTFPHLPGHYIIEQEHGTRWYELWYTPHSHQTAARRIQIEHTDLHEKAVAAMEANAHMLLAHRAAIRPKE